jgi:tRNA dimethylallyltransferase
VQVCAVFGPTASGKSAVAIELAALVDGEIVSCDAMQLYRGLPILTNQPSTGDLARAPHHLVGVWDTRHEGSVAEYAQMAHETVDAIVARGRTAIVVGGSGLYMRAALVQMGVPPRVDADRRRAAERMYDARGSRAAHAALAEVDPPAAAGVHPHDRRRVVRALELADAGSSLAPGDDRLWSGGTRLPTLVCGLDLDPDETARRIAARTRAMFAAGVVDEVTAARAAGLSHTAARIHGVQDVSALIDGEIDAAEAVRRLDVRTRRYAKRQRTWMRKLPGLRPVPAGRPATEVAAAIAELL